jgi:hypothetical protein
MSISLSSPVTGTAQTDFTSPTYTVEVDSAPDNNGRQYAVTALGGTQANVRTHTISDPFTITFVRPRSPKGVPAPNPVTGRYGAIPMNTTSVIVRKGVNFGESSPTKTMLLRLYIDVPAGADAYDSTNVRAAMSLLIGALSAESAGMGDLLVTGII